MRIFAVMEETGGGRMRVVQPGETLELFIEETLKDEDLIRSCTHRWPDDEDDDPYSDFNSYDVLKARLYDQTHPVEDLSEWNANWGQYAADDEGQAPKILKAYSEDKDYIMSWFEAEVPDNTRYLYNGGCWPTTEHYCGMGGAGYISFEKEEP